MRRPTTLAVAVVCVLALSATVAAAPPRLSVEHAVLTVNSSTCVGQATTAMLAAGFRNTNLTQNAVNGQTDFLSGSITCVPGGGKSMAIIAVSGPADSGNATSSMTGRLRRALGGAPISSGPASTASSQQVARAEPASSIEWNTDRPGKDIRSMMLNGSDPKLCIQECAKEEKCKAWTWVKPTGRNTRGHCWLKFDVPNKRPSNRCISGVMQQ